MNAEQARRKFADDFGHDVLRLLDIIIDDRITKAVGVTNNKFNVERAESDQPDHTTPPTPLTRR